MKMYNSYLIMLILLISIIKYSSAQQLNTPTLYSTAEIEQLEYFIDTDPGIGKAVALVISSSQELTGTFNIPLVHIKTGLHTLYVRAKDSNNKWSITQNMSFFSFNNLMSTITELEYYIDTDPGIGKGISIPVNPSANLTKQIHIGLNDVTPGIHLLCIRARDQFGKWSMVQHSTFYKFGSPLGRINTLEYFIDTDPGVGLAQKVSITPPLKEIEKSFIVALTGLPVGNHTLGVRVADERNHWSSLEYKNFTICALPSKPLKPAGDTQLCVNSPNSLYETPIVDETNAYQWHLYPSTAGVITGSFNTATVDWNDAYEGKAYIAVRRNNNCGESAPSDSLEVTIISAPIQANDLTGPSNVCANEGYSNYTITEAENATSYNWSIRPLEAGVITGIGNSAQVHWNSSFSGEATISVQGQNLCGESPVTSFVVNVNPLPAKAGAIAGAAIICQNQLTMNYEVPAIANASSYSWTLPKGASGTSTSNTITVNYGSSSVSGNLTVKGINSCGEGEASTLGITVHPKVTPEFVLVAAICQGDVLNALPTTSINGISGTWLPTLDNTKTTTYTFNPASGECASETTLTITVNPIPGKPSITQNGDVLHSDATTGNQWYDTNGLVIGATNQDYMPKTSGDYYVIVTAATCSSSPSNTIKFIPTGIPINELSKSIKVYPNPVTDELTIECDNHTEIDFEIINSISQLVFKSSFVEKAVVQTSNFPSGIYFIRLKSGELSEYMKIVKE